METSDKMIENGIICCNGFENGPKNSTNHNPGSSELLFTVHDATTIWQRVGVEELVKRRLGN